ncbi:hypothetical protein H0W32_00015 [Patescibacteria group bacterium]|nr:hypothetical protein [Patescibacteria group bacterium]
MKISNKYSQFINKEALLITAGRQDAKFYQIKEGRIEEVLSIKIPRPKYSDNEGLFQKSVHGRMQSGSIEINNKEPIIRDFLSELEKRSKEVKGQFSDIYIFAPSNTKNKIEKALPASWKKKINSITEGNYYSKSPIFLIDKISQAEQKPFRAIKKSEENILKTAQIAGRVMRSR